MTVDVIWGTLTKIPEYCDVLFDLHKMIPIGFVVGFFGEMSA